MYRTYDGRLIKKRDNKNIILVTNYEKYLYRIKEVNDYLDAVGYIGDIISLSLSVLDDFRQLHILFDYNNKDHKRVYELMREVTYKKWSFDINVILFDAILGQIIEEQTVTVK